ncbi:hypothetical protein RFI_16084, partial [Reticulomyxa filosa]
MSNESITSPKQDENMDMASKSAKPISTPLQMAEKFKALFTEYDKNGDGLIDYSEWKDLIQNSADVALDHLSEGDTQYLFDTLSNHSEHIKYPDLVTDLTNAAKQNPTMPASEFVNSFFARFFAAQTSPSHSNQENNGDVLDTLHQKYEALKQQWKEKEMEWAEEKITLETEIRRLEIDTQQMKAENEETESELNFLRNMEAEHYRNKEDKSILTEQMFVMKDDIRRVHDELERVNELNRHFKHQVETWKEYKAKQAEEQRKVLNEKQDLIQDSKLLEMKLQATQGKFDEIFEKHNQALVQLEELEQSYKQQ